MPVSKSAVLAKTSPGNISLGSAADAWGCWASVEWIVGLELTMAGDKDYDWYPTEVDQLVNTVALLADLLASLQLHVLLRRNLWAIEVLTEKALLLSHGVTRPKLLLKWRSISIESQGLAACIQVTECIDECLLDKYQFNERGVIQVKGKGEMTTYLLTGRKVQNSIAC